MSTGRVVATILAASVVSLLAAQAAGAGQEKGADCRSCHSCATPTTQDPCLVACPRPKARTARGPDQVVLGELEKLYEPVRFNHRAHSDMTKFGGDCTLCHHHTPAGGEHPSCKSCHDPGVAHENLAKPGLKGAYHRQCMGCHQEWEGETSCEICHARKAAGGSPAATFHGSREPLRMKELIVFETGYAPGDKVPFHHKAHSTRYENDCTACHEDQGCTKCHQQNHVPHPMGRLEDVNLHEACFRCHRSGNTTHPQNECATCHGRAEDDLFRHESTGWPLRAYHRDLGCRACHPPWQTAAKLDSRCESCHAEGFAAASFAHDVTGVMLDDVHREAGCADCHAQGFGPAKAVTCDACHDDSRRYDAKTGFGSGS